MVIPGNWAPPRWVLGCEWPPNRETLERSRANRSWSQLTASPDLPVKTLIKSSLAKSLADFLVSLKKIWIWKKALISHCFFLWREGKEKEMYTPLHCQESLVLPVSVYQHRWYQRWPWYCFHQRRHSKWDKKESGKRSGHFSTPESGGQTHLVQDEDITSSLQDGVRSW